MEKKQKVWIRGNEDYPEKVIDTLIKLGGKTKTNGPSGDEPNNIYYINHVGIVSCCDEYVEYAKIVMEEYQEIKLEEKEDYKFKPFDKVLVRYAADVCWDIDFFSHYENSSARYSCLQSCYSQCIPYNDKTKHLLNTTMPYVE